MEYQTRTYFTENEVETVKGFTIIGTAGDEYHIAEKWNKADGGNKWVQYHVPEGQLLARVEADKCEQAATLSQEQYEKVCEQIDHSEVTAEEVTA